MEVFRLWKHKDLTVGVLGNWLDNYYYSEIIYWSVFVNLIFGSSIVISTLVSEFTKIQLLPFSLLEEKERIYPIYQDNPNGEYYKLILKS